jgi:hypothetical protein
MIRKDIIAIVWEDKDDMETGGQIDRTFKS